MREKPVPVGVHPEQRNHHMALKDFDFKGYLLQKGEWIGVLTAGGIAALFVVLCIVIMISSGSPKTLAQPVADLTTPVQSGLTQAPPDAVTTIPPDLNAAVEMVHLD